MYQCEACEWACGRHQGIICTNKTQLMRVESMCNAVVRAAKAHRGIYVGARGSLTVRVTGVVETQALPPCQQHQLLHLHYYQLQHRHSLQRRLSPLRQRSRGQCVSH
jgi:hypothetical protein